MFPVVLAQVHEGDMEGEGNVERDAGHETGYAVYEGRGSEFVPLRKLDGRDSDQE